jgi:hypothetical protein
MPFMFEKLVVHQSAVGFANPISSPPVTRHLS